MAFEYYRTLSNGNKIPTLSFGTDYIPKGDICVQAVTDAIKTGYRHIDNADCYDNQESVGIAIKNCIDKKIVKREDLFIVSKVPDWKQGYEETKACLKKSLEDMKLDYFDLYLVHSPLRGWKNWQEKILETYKALEECYEAGLIKNIGVSNFNRGHLMFLRQNVNIMPVVNQVEIHPEHQNKDVMDVCFKSYIQPIAWGTLNQGRIFKNKTFLKLAEKYGVSHSQIAVRWNYQKGYCSLARSIKKEHIETNFKIENFEISPEDMQILDNLDGGEWSNTHDDCLFTTQNNKQQLRPSSSLKSKYYLFGFIPFLTCKQKTNKTKWYLFGIPVLKIKQKGE